MKSNKTGKLTVLVDKIDTTGIVLELHDKLAKIRENWENKVCDDFTAIRLTANAVNRAKYQHKMAIGSYTPKIERHPDIQKLCDRLWDANNEDQFLKDNTHPQLHATENKIRLTLLKGGVVWVSAIDSVVIIHDRSSIDNSVFRHTLHYLHDNTAAIAYHIKSYFING